MASGTKQLTVGRRRITVSNLDKLLYPGTKFTKAKVIDYYINVSKFLLPHLKDRPVTQKRFPDGVFGDAFYEKDARPTKTRVPYRRSATMNRRLQNER